MNGLRERILAACDPVSTASGVAGQSDFDLNPWARPEPRELKPAAVLCPIVLRPDGETFLLTRRSQTLRSHTGQIAFPGGRCDPGETIVETALREAEEEIGLAAEFIEPVGVLTPYETVTGYVVTPVVSFVTPGFRLTINPGEVAEAFEVPFGFLMDEANHLRHFREPMGGGEKRYFYAMPFEDYYIWGATAGMLRGLSDRLQTSKAA